MSAKPRCRWSASRPDCRIPQKDQTTASGLRSAIVAHALLVRDSRKKSCGLRVSNEQARPHPRSQDEPEDPQRGAEETSLADDLVRQGHSLVRREGRSSVAAFRVLRCGDPVQLHDESLVRAAASANDGDVLEMAGLDWPVSDFSTLRRRQKNLAVQIPYRRSAGPLNLPVNRTGIKVLGQGGPVAPLARRKPSEREWLTRKHDPHRRRQYRKIHLAMDEATGDVRAVEFPRPRGRQSGPGPGRPEARDRNRGRRLRHATLSHADPGARWCRAEAAEVDRGNGRKDCLHRARLASGKRLPRELQRPVPQRDAPSEGLLFSPRGPDHSSSGYVAPHAHCPGLQPQATQSIMDVDRRPVMH